MTDLHAFLIDDGLTVRAAMQKLDETGERILFVAPGGVLRAVVTDGDIRKFLLRGGSLDDTVMRAANAKPISLPAAERAAAREVLSAHGIDALPLLDGDGRVVEIAFARRRGTPARHALDLPVVMMAGGLGTRLYPYTKILPKPLIPVGEKPIAELIMERFAAFGCRDFRVIVNYKKSMIKSYFADLVADYRVSFVDEEQFLGTGGGLSLLKGRLDKTFFFTNCDTLLDLDYAALYDYHKRRKNVVTMVVAAKHYTVPYGVVEADEDGAIQQMREKPALDFLTNTGVYVVEPRVVEEMTAGEKIGFPDVIERYRRQGENVGVFPISEASWMDMGQLEELEKMRRRLEEQA